MPSLKSVTQRLSDEVTQLQFSQPVTHVYNPLDYAWEPHCEYLSRYGEQRGRIVLLGMNPGPFGMAQTGVPFGDVGMVRDWMGIHTPVRRPQPEHPKRPVLGFNCPRGEVSGRRLWGWAQARYASPAAFFSRFFVVNFCPLVFMESTGRNRTPDKLIAPERDALYAICDRALAASFAVLQPGAVIGIGRFAHDRAKRILNGVPTPLLLAPHPSPASPLANRGWAPLMDAVVDRCPGS